MALNVELLESSFAQIKVNSLEVTKRFYIAVYRLSRSPAFVCQYPYGKAGQATVSISSLPSNLRKPDALSDALRLGHSTRSVRCIANTINGGR